MKKAATDSELSIASEEFVWNEEGLTPVHRLVLPELRRQLIAGHVRSVLDLGCGNGAASQQISAWGFKVVGMDSSHSGIDLANKKESTARFETADIAQPLRAGLHGQFDAVVAIEVIEHLMFPRQLFHRAREALRPGGQLVLTTPFHGYWKNLALALLNRFDEHWHPLRDLGHIKFFSERTLSALFIEMGFMIESSKRLGRIAPLACSLMIEGRLC
jgi:2-polyprenyl-6-hydroxyphenyl methylase/3-demethylubiquinone-9 3-methyltransferase